MAKVYEVEYTISHDGFDPDMVYFATCLMVKPNTFEDIRKLVSIRKGVSVEDITVTSAFLSKGSE